MVPAVLRQNGVAMRANRAVRVVFGLLALILFGVYTYFRVSTTPFSNEVGVQASEPEAGVTETAVPETEPSPEPAPEATPEPTLDPNSPAGRANTLGLPAPPDIDINSWEYMLVNADHSIEQYEPPEMVEIEGKLFDSRVADALNAFVADTRAQGLSVYLSSSYRSYSDQAANFQRIINNGYANGKTSDGFYVTMPPGCSEHQTGLTCDITDVYYELKNSSIENTETYQYMSAHCQDFGFIVRFPESKKDITGVMYEPWHFRYVGVEAATYIMENNLCLEEFVALYTGE